MSKNVPKLRFKKRDGDDYPEWESKKISEIFTFYSTNSLSRDKLTDEETEMKNIHYGDIHTKFGSILDVDKMILPYIKEEAIKSIKNYTEAIDGDVFIADASEDYADIGKATEINNVNDAKIVGGLHVLHLRDEKEIYVNGIKGFLFNSPNIRNQIKIVAVGSKVLGLSKPSLGGLEISIMSKEEQSKIASFFSAIDSRITNQSSKLDTLRELKKGVMQKIFSQEIRFKREDGGEYPEWEDVSIKDILKIRHGRSQKSVEDENGLYPILGTGGLMAYANDYLYDKPSVLIGRKGTIDKPQYMETPFWTVDTLFYSEIFSGTHPKFVYYLFQTINWKNYNEASGVPSLSASTISSIEISCPSEPEQQKIADFLSTLDSKISLESQILETLQTLKKGLLQQMFV
jgi:type I restriction enzyme S subunit